MDKKPGLLQGTLDLMLLQALVAMGPQRVVMDRIFDQPAEEPGK